MKKIKKIFLIVFIALPIYLLPIISFADEAGMNSGQFPNPIQAKSFPEVFGLIIKGILGITGSLALVMFIYGGLTWMTAAGNGERVQKGKDILIWATVGMAVIFGSYALIRFIFTALGIS